MLKSIGIVDVAQIFKYGDNERLNLIKNWTWTPSYMIIYRIY